jgi:branched-chain amino acid transport system substrate-binding protein
MYRKMRRKPTRRWKTVTAGAAIATALATAACSSSSTPASTTNGTTGASSGGLSGTPYVIGNIGNYSGPYAPDSVGARDALQAWEKYTNAHGGINGHPVKVIIMDDQTSASVALTDVKQLIQQDHIIALVGVESITEVGWIPYMAQQPIPMIGDDLANTATTTYPNFFAEGTTDASEYYYGLPKVAALLGKTSYGAIYCSEGAVCSQIANAQKGQASAAGVKFLFSTAAAAASTSYTAQCLAAKNSGATAMALLLGEAIADRVAAACEQQGYHPQFLQGSNGFTQGEASSTSLQGVVGPVPDFPWFASSTPAEQQFQSAMRQYEPQDFTSNSTYGYSQGSSLAWASAEIFAAAAKSLPAPGTATGKDVMSALRNLPPNDTFGGLTPPITYSKSGPNPPVTCFFMIKLVNHTYSVLSGGKTVCQP